MAVVKILAFAGSARSGSLNKNLVGIAAQFTRNHGAEVTVLDLRDYPLPLYDGDLEAAHGLPEPVRTLKRMLSEHHGLLIASPENNGSVSAPLKNMLDWISRSEGTQPRSLSFQNKVAAIVAASPGVYGGLRGLLHLRQILNSLGVLVLASHVAVGRANQVLTEEGKISDATLSTAVDGLCAQLVETTRKFIA